jgi:hypothetical protein
VKAGAASGLPKAVLGSTSGSVSSPASATKDKPFINSLGMKFVPVPGTKVLFCIWCTRVMDYAAYAREKSTALLNSGFEQTVDHPVVLVSWDDAVTFCEWLAEKEKRKYRLPTDLEWSAAVGLPKEQGETPAERRCKERESYPWGVEWPPPIEYGNYGSALKIDDYDQTSPVGSFPANKFGLFDLGGNVNQWCIDWYNHDQKDKVSRGCSWGLRSSESLLSSARGHSLPASRTKYLGFRIVLADDREFLPVLVPDENDRDKSNERFFVNQTWRSPTGTDFTFLKRGEGFREFNGRDRTLLTWRHIEPDLIEVTYLANQEGKLRTSYFRFDSSTEAYYGSSRKLEAKLTNVNTP